MANTRFLNVTDQVLSDTGQPLSGAKLYFYAAGTSTPKTTYSDAALTAPNPNPLVADAAGRFGDVFLAAGPYKVVLTTAAGVTLRTMDPVEAEVVTTSAFMAGLLDDASATAALTTLGVSAFMQGVLDDTSAAAAQATLGLAGTAAWRNALLNGDFRVHQRSTASVTVGGSYVVDRWLVGAQGGSRTVQRAALADADRTAIGREGAEWCLHYAATGGAGGSDYESLAQRIEGVRSLAGQTVTLSFWARRTAGSGNMAVELEQNFGTGGSPSAPVLSGGTLLALTTAWQRFTVTVALPSLAGKTLGSNGDDSLYLRLWFSAGASFNARTGGLGAQTITVQVADVMLEPGPTASAFVPRPLPQELALCMRYFTALATPHVVAASAGAGTVHRHPLPLPVPMRTTPTFVPITAPAMINCTGFGGTANSPMVAHFAVTMTVAAGNAYEIAPGGLVHLSAEL